MTTGANSSGKVPSRKHRARRDQAAVVPAGPRRDVLAGEVLDKASALFARKGFAATSLQDVADSVGLSRTSIYYYFDSKDALLRALVQDVTGQAAHIIDVIEARVDLPPAEKVREAARQLVLWVTDPGTHFKLVDRCEHELPASIAAVHRQAKLRVLGGMAQLIEAAMATGAFRLVDTRVAAFAVIGMCNWTAWWYAPGGSKSREEIAGLIAEQAVASLRRTAPAGPVGTDVKSLTAAIRQELDLIDLVHGGGPGGGAPTAET